MCRYTVKNTSEMSMGKDIVIRGHENVSGQIIMFKCGSVPMVFDTKKVGMTNVNTNIER